MTVNYFQQANQQLKAGELKQAIASYQKAIEKNPNFAWYYYRLGESLEKLHCWEEAIASYQMAIKINPNNVLFRHKLAKILIAKGDLDVAIEVFQEGLKLQPINHKYYEEMADVLAQKFQWKQAIDYYKKTLAINSDLPAVQSKLADAIKSREIASQSSFDIEKEFARQNGIDFLLMNGKNSNNVRDTYKLIQFVENNNLNRNLIVNDITALKISRNLRFGNSILQISNAYHIAKAIGAKRIYIDNCWYLKEGESITRSGITIVNTHQPNLSSEKLVLEGIYFNYLTLAPLSSSRPNLYLNMIDLMELIKLMPSGEPLGAEDLVIHIRSGDIFSDQNPHLGYGQPPLSFYQKIITLKTWNSISLVFEDKSNPIIQPLIDFAKNYCPLVSLISGNLKEDIEYLLRAEVLVVSYGTFCSGITIFSNNIRTVYYFERLNPLHKTNISTIRIIDKQGIYKSTLLNNNWMNTEAQRQMMLSYPISSLDLDLEKSDSSAFLNLVEIDKNHNLKVQTMFSNTISDLLPTILIMKPNPSPVKLIRIGGEKDGAYLIPNDLENIKACFSPGVENRKIFEDELTDSYGIQCHMCDKSSDVEKFQTPLKEGMQTFKKKWLDVNGEPDTISLDDWVKELTPNEKDDLILQMDIEGAEYRNILQTSDQVLKRFRIIIIEVHGLGVVRNPEQFEVNLGPFLRKIDKHFICVHAHPNNCCGDFTIVTPDAHINLPNVYELTFLRRDRFDENNISSYYEPMMPHPLDIKRNVSNKPPIFLSEESCTQVPQTSASTIKLLEDKLDYYMSTIPKEEPKKQDAIFEVYRLAQSIANNFLSEDNLKLEEKDINEIAEGKRYYLSSSFGNYPKEGLVETKNPFFFHTGLGLNQYITIDLEKEYILTSLLIVNRVDVCKERARCLFYTVHQNLQPDLSCGLPLNIHQSFWQGKDLECNTILKKVKARYITIFSPEDTALHFSSLKVFGVFNNEDTLSHNFYHQTTLPYSPPKEIPTELRVDFTLGNHIPVIYSYYNNTRTSPVYIRLQAYYDVFDKLENGSFKYYGKTLHDLLNALDKYSISGKTVLIFGLEGINCDAISLWKGAKDVYVIDYNLPVSEHLQVHILSYEDYISQNIQADVAISISSFEHDGLGRYGDPISPNGDLDAMKSAKNLIKKDGLLFFSVPIGQDCIVWNAHRIYGKVRLPMMLEGWEILDSFGFSDSLMTNQDLGRYEQPVFVLKNL